MRMISTWLMASIVLFACKTKTAESTEAKDTATTVAANPAAMKMADNSAEFADEKYVHMGRRQLVLFHNGNIDEWAKQFTDNAVYIWSAGDSLAGKQAIMDYWKNRRDNVIQSIEFTNDIFLPVKVIKPQRGPDLPGVWLLGWYQFEVTYKNGQKASGWIHTDVHYTNNDQVDRVVQYIDRAPIQKVSAGLGQKDTAKS